MSLAHATAPEPRLAQPAQADLPWRLEDIDLSRIDRDAVRGDETRHYSQFLHFFQKYQGSARARRWPVLRALVRRVTEAGDDDGLCAYRHAFETRYPSLPFEKRYYRAFQREVKSVMRRHFPVEMAVKMLLKPLDLPAMISRPLGAVLARTAGLVFI